MIDVLLVDIRGIDKFALKRYLNISSLLANHNITLRASTKFGSCCSIHIFLFTQNVGLYSGDGVPCHHKVAHIYADFSIGLLVDKLGPTPQGACSFNNH